MRPPLTRDAEENRDHIADVETNRRDGSYRRENHGRPEHRETKTEGPDDAAGRVGAVQWCRWAAMMAVAAVHSPRTPLQDVACPATTSTTNSQAPIDVRPHQSHLIHTALTGVRVEGWTLCHQRLPGMAPSRENAYTMRLLLVTEAMQQKNWPRRGIIIRAARRGIGARG